MSPQEALVEVEAALGEHPGDLMVGKARIRRVLDLVRPHYWLPAAVDALVDDYRAGDMGAVHRIIAEIIDRADREGAA